jgi:hypothetical protein
VPSSRTICAATATRSSLLPPVISSAAAFARTPRDGIQLSCRSQLHTGEPSWRGPPDSETISAMSSERVP